ncbi:hypothetical protein HZA96_00075 [Candidatus Woesearchaeota archaeon]|nr:hypothetical protein [Candidatus Woesearchaeota archaeon]
MIFHSIQKENIALDRDIKSHLPKAQHQNLDYYLEKLAGVLISADEIAAAIDNAAKMIAEDYLSRGIRSIVGVYVLDGAKTVFQQLEKSLYNYGLTIIEDNIRASRYGSSLSGGVVRITSDVKHVYPGDNVLLIEDIFDEGITMCGVAKHLETHSNPADVKLLSLLFKSKNYEGKRRVEYSIIKIDDHWIVGYGMDMGGQIRKHANEGTLEQSTLDANPLRPILRDLPFIAAANPDYLIKTGQLKLKDGTPDTRKVEYLKGLIKFDN